MGNLLRVLNWSLNHIHLESRQTTLRLFVPGSMFITSSSSSPSSWSVCITLPCASSPDKIASTVHSLPAGMKGRQKVKALCASSASCRSRSLTLGGALGTRGERALACCPAMKHAFIQPSITLLNPLFNSDTLRKKKNPQQPAADDLSHRVCRWCTRRHRLAVRKWVFSLPSLWDNAQ